MPAKASSNIQSVLRYLGVAPAAARDIELEELAWPTVYPNAAIHPMRERPDQGWDNLRVRKRKALRTIAGYMEAVRRNPSLRSFLEPEIDAERRIHDLIDTYLPDDDFFASAGHDHVARIF
ncbi:MAG TPA: hypothetical protein VIB82_10120 [Caulobacteraceae bacterium]|jgi:hypothetical protein